MPEKVYVAASFEQTEEVREVQRLLREAGHTITADWTVHEEIANLPTEKERNELRKRYVIEDVEGVKSASTYILLLGDRKSTGAHIELGIAIGAGTKNIILVGKADPNQLFYSHSGIVIVPDVATLLKLLK